MERQLTIIGDIPHFNKSNEMKIKLFETNPTIEQITDAIKKEKKSNGKSARYKRLKKLLKNFHKSTDELESMLKYELEEAYYETFRMIRKLIQDGKELKEYRFVDNMTNVGYEIMDFLKEDKKRYNVDFSISRKKFKKMASY